MILKKFSVFYVLFFICLTATIVRGQASMQRGVRISNANGNIVTIQTGIAPQTYSLVLPLTSNPSLTTASVLYGLGTGNLTWTDITGVADGWLLALKTSGGNLVPTWIDPTTIGAWALNGNATISAWNGSAGNFLGTTSAQPLVVATTNSTPQDIIFMTGNTEKMRLLGSGELGIGLSPVSGRLLDVGGTSGTANIRFTSLSGADLNTALAATDGLVIADNNGDLTKRSPSILGTVLAGSYVQYDLAGTQNISATRPDYLFNVAYANAASDANAAGAVITSASGATNRSAAGLAVTATATGTGTSTGLNVTAGGGATNYAALFNGGRVGIGQSTPSQLLEVRDGNLFLSNSGTASQLQLQGTGTGLSTLQAGAQGTNIFNLTLPTSTPSANQVLGVNAISGAGPYAITLGWQNIISGSFVNYNTTSVQNSGVITSPNYLFNVAYAGSATTNDALGAVISSVGGTSGATNATGLAVTATANSTGTSTALNVTAGGGSTNYAALFNGGKVGIGQSAPTQLLEVRNGNFLLSNSGTADQLQFQGTSSGITTFQAGAQGATNINYTLPTSASAANGYVLASTTGGVMSWTDPSALVSSNYWSLAGNAIASAWNGAAGSFLGTTSTQPLVVATTNTTTPQPIEFFTNNAEKMRLTSAGNLGINQTNPSQLLDVANGNILLSNSGTAGQLQFQGTSSGITSLQAGAQGANTYNVTFPITTPAANQVLGVSAISGAGPYSIALGWQNVFSGSFVNYNTASAQNTAIITSPNYLFNVAYTSSATTNNALGAVITSVGGTSGATNASGLAVTATANGAGTSTGLNVTASGGTTNYAALFSGGNVGIGQVSPTQLLEVRNGNFLLSNSGTADQLQFQGTSTGITTFQAGVQGATNINYTLPTAAAVANGYVLSSTTGGVMSWSDPSSLIASNYWSLTGNATASAWNGAAGNFLGTTSTQPLVVATTNTTTPQPIEFFTNNVESARIASTGEFGIGLTPTAGRLLHVAGTGGTANIRFNSLSGADLNTALAATDGLVIADNNGDLTKRSPSVLGTALTGSYVQYDISSQQSISVTRANNLFNVAYNAAATDANAAGAIISSVGGATNRSANGLAVTATATGTGTSTGLNVTAGGGGTNYAALFSGGNVGIGQATPTQLLELRNGNFLLSNSGSADQLQFQGTSTGITTFQAGVQGATNINYTLPISAAAANNYVMASTTAGVLSWVDASTITNDWHLIGNATASAWNGAAGNFLGTTSTQPLVVATTNTTTPQPIEFFTNNTEKMRLLPSGNFGIGQTNPSQLLEVRNGNFLLSNSGSADQLQFQGTSTGITTFQAGVQGATNINYTLPISAAAANNYVMASTIAGVLSWVDASTITNDWHLIGNATASAWNGAAGNFLGTTSTQPLVVATTNTTTPQPIEFFTNNTEKMRLLPSGNLGIGQTNPSQLLEVRNGNLLLSNSGSADQLQFQGTGAGTTSFLAGAQGVTNLTYTLPISAPSANSLFYSLGGAASNLSWSNAGSNGQILTVTGGVPSWQNASILNGNFVLYDVTTPQNLSVTRTDNLFNVAYAAGANDANAAGGVVTSVGGATNRSATGLSVTATATGTGTSTGLNVTSGGGGTNYAALFNGGNVGIGQAAPTQLLEVRNGNLLLSNSGSADQLQFQGTSTGLTTFQAGVQGATNINYTLPISAAAANNYVMASTTTGTLSWVDVSTITNDWHLIGNATGSAWNGAAGSFLGTTSTQPLVVATTNTTTPQPIEFFTNNAEKMRIASSGNVGINQTNPSQLLEVRNGNLLISNSGSSGQLQLQGSSTGASTFLAGSQGAVNINYTLPVSSPSANSLLYSSGGATNNLVWSNTGSNGQILIVTAGVPSWQNSNTLTGFVLYDVTTPQNSSVTRTDNLFNLAYGAGANDVNAAGAVISSTGGATNRSATALSLTSAATGTGTSTGLSVTASGGTTQTAIIATGNINLLSAGGVASNLSLQNPAGTFASSFTSGTQAANINYTLPISVAASNGYVLSSSTTGSLSWVDATTVTNDWHLIGNATGSAWNGAAGSFLGTTSTQPLVIATTNTTTPQPIEFFTNNTEKMRLLPSGNFGIGQTNPSQLFEVRNGNFLLSNSGASDQLQFQGTGSGITTFAAGAQGVTNLNYTLPISAPVANSLLYSSGGAASNLSWSNTGTAGQILTITGGIPSWQNSNTLTGFVLYDVTTPQNSSVTRTDNLFNLAYGAGGNDANAAGAVISSTGGATNRSATALSLTSTATGTGTSTGLSITSSGGTTQTAISATGNINLLSAGGLASSFSLQNPAGTFATSFSAGAQIANIGYTLPTAGAAANGYVLSATTTGVLSWSNPTVLLSNNYWTLSGNSGTTAYNGATGNFLGTTDAQPLVLATTFTATPQPIEFFANNLEKMRIAANGNVGIGQTNPSQLLELKNGNLLFSNTTGTADQLQLQGTAAGITTFAAGAQGATNLNYTLPILTPAASSLLYSSGGAASNLSWSNTGTAGQILTITGGIPSWQNSNTLTGFVLYDVTTPQNASVTRTDNLFNIAYGAGGNDANAAGAVITSVGGATNRNATGLSVTTTATGTGTSTGLNITTGGGTTNYAATFSGGNVGIGQVAPTQLLEVKNGNLLLSNSATADQLQFQGTSTGLSTFAAGVQGANTFNYTLPITTPSANQVLTATAVSGAGPFAVTLGWQNASGSFVNYNTATVQNSAVITSPNYLFNAAYAASATANNALGGVITSASGTSAATNATGLAVTATANGAGTSTALNVTAGGGTTNYAALFNGGNVGIGQATPSQLLEVRNGNLLLSNSGSADQLQFQGTSTGITTLQAGAQGVTSLNYTLPITAPAASSLLYSSGGAASNLSWSNTGSNGQILTITAGVPSWQNASALNGSFVQYDVTSAQNGSATRTDNLFNVAYAAGASDVNAAGAVITSVGGATNRNATGLSVTTTATGTGTSTGLNVTAGGGGTNYSALFNGGNVGIGQATPTQLLEVKNGNLLLSNSATADQLQFQGTSTGLSTFQAGVQGANTFNYTLPITTPTVNQVLTASAVSGAGPFAVTLSWAAAAAAGSYVNYNTASIQNTAVITSPNYLFNVAYAASATANNALGGVITAASGTSAATNATGLAVTATANGAGTSTGLNVTASGGTTNYAALFNGGRVGIGNATPTQLLEVKSGNLLLSNAGAADQLQFQGTSTGISTFQAGAQGATNINYTLPLAAPVANNYVLTATTGGVMSWTDPAALPPNDWHLTGNSATTAYNGATGNFIGTTDAQPFVLGTTFTTTSQPIEFFTNNTEKMRLLPSGNLGIGQTNPTQLLEVRNGNLLLSNSATADQLQFQGTSTGLSTFAAGVQGANTFNYTLPITTPTVNQVLTASAVSGAGPFAVTLSWAAAAAAGSYVNYNTASVQNTAVITSPNYLFDVAYAASATANNALGAIISSSSGTSAATNATGLAVTATANGAGTSTGLNVTAGGGTTNYAALFNGGRVGIGNAAPATGLDLSSDFATRELNYATAMPASSNDVNFDASGNLISLVRIANAAAPFTITGFAGGRNGKMLTVYNATGQALSIANQSASSVAANRVITGTAANVVLQSGSSVDFKYSPTDARWFIASLNDLSQLPGMFVNYNTATAQNTAVITSANYLYNIAYAASATTNNALGALITSASGTSGATNATGLGIVSTANGAGTSTGLNVNVSGGTTNYAALFNGGNVGIGQTAPTQLLEVKNGNLLLSNSATADQLQFQGTSTGLSTFQAGVQGANTFNYTLPITTPTVNQVLTASAVSGASPYAVTLSWAAAGGGSFVNYNTAAVQNSAIITSPNYLFNVAYAASATTNNALGGVISSVGGTSGNTNATGLAITATAHSTGTSTGLNVNASGGTNNYAALFQSGRVAIGNAAPATGLDLSSDFATREYNYATSLVGTKNDVNFDGANNSISFVRLATASGGFTLTGFTGGQNGKRLTIYNGTAQTMTIANQSASSVAANRIITGTQVNIPIPTGGSCDMVYSTTESRWIISSTSGVSGWLYTGNSGLTDNVNNYHGTLDDIPIRFVAGASGAPSTKMLLDINGNLLFGPNSGATSFPAGTAGRLAFGDNLNTVRLGSVPTFGTRIFNMIDQSAVLRVWRFNSNAGGTDPAIELIGGTNDDQGNSANHWWDVYATGTPGVAGTGTGGGYGEHMAFRRRTGAHDSEYLSVFAGGNIGIGNNGVNGVATPDTRLVVRQVDGATSTISNLVSLYHSSSAGNGITSGFGSGLVFKAEDTTVDNQEMARIAAIWTNTVDASRTGALTFSTVNNGLAEAERVRISGVGYVGVGTTTPAVSMDINGALATEATNIALSNGTNNNLALTNQSFARITGPTAAFTVTGVAGGVDGQILRIENTTAQNMTISHSSASSTAGNRIYSPSGSDVVLKGQNSSAELIYDATNTQWVLTNSNSNQITGPIGSIAYMTKAADQSVTNSAVLANDADISFSTNPNETWEIHGELHADNTVANSNIKIAFTIPAGSTMKIYYTGIQDGGVSAGASILTASGVAKTITIAAGAVSTYIQLHGIVRNGGTGGTVQLKWAQGTANAQSTILRQDSFIKAVRVN